MKEIGTTCGRVQERNALRTKLIAHGKPKVRTGKKWTEERKQKHRELMRQYLDADIFWNDMEKTKTNLGNFMGPR